MLAILTGNKPAISTLRKMDKGMAPRSEVEARILRNSATVQQVWQRHLRGLGGGSQGGQNEETDKLCRETSILGHELEGVGLSGNTVRFEGVE